MVMALIFFFIFLVYIFISGGDPWGLEAANSIHPGLARNGEVDDDIDVNNHHNCSGLHHNDDYSHDDGDGDDGDGAGTSDKSILRRASLSSLRRSVFSTRVMLEMSQMTKMMMEMMMIMVKERLDLKYHFENGLVAKMFIAFYFRCNMDHIALSVQHHCVQV